ncbi:MAG TPA: hypothetical protein EYP36_06220 [Calditrichaeota bacterium]|nr:hypothetical protein [Calditrichota bacterium]
MLVKRITLARSNEGDNVLDPFCGKATTGVNALRAIIVNLLVSIRIKKI